MKAGVIEQYLGYKKLHRTGRLFRGLKTKVLAKTVQLYNTAPYAEEHEYGMQSGKATVPSRYLTGGAKGAAVGGKLHIRSFMRPSKVILRAPVELITKRMKKLGW